MPILVADNITNHIHQGDVLSIDFLTGKIFDKTQEKIFYSKPFSDAQLGIYKKGGLLKNP
jgi:hypothetical protein